MKRRRRYRKFSIPHHFIMTSRMVRRRLDSIDRKLDSIKATVAMIAKVVASPSETAEPHRPKRSLTQAAQTELAIATSMVESAKIALANRPPVGSCPGPEGATTPPSDDADEGEEEDDGRVANARGDSLPPAPPSATDPKNPTRLSAAGAAAAAAATAGGRVPFQTRVEELASILTGLDTGTIEMFCDAFASEDTRPSALAGIARVVAAEVDYSRIIYRVARGLRDPNWRYRSGLSGPDHYLRYVANTYKGEGLGHLAAELRNKRDAD